MNKALRPEYKAAKRYGLPKSEHRRARNVLKMLVPREPARRLPIVRS
jgi:hypothetical protein